MVDLYKPGNIVRYKKETGITVVKDGNLMIRWDTCDEDDYEELGGCWAAKIKILDSYNFKWINNDGTPRIKT